MKQWLLLIAGWIPTWAVAQFGGPDASVFNSVALEEKAYDGFSITSGYYTIANNIDHPPSTAFISHTPSAEEHLYFAQHQPSYYFFIHRQREVLRIILLRQRVRDQRSEFFYTVIDPISGHRTQVPSRLGGELTQLRAKELVMSHLDPPVSLVEGDSVCLFEQNRYSVQPLADVRQEVVALAQQLLSKDQSRVKELKEYIRAETIGGTLDFEVALSVESREHFYRDGVSYGKRTFSVLLWGGAVRMLGLLSVDTAQGLWEDIQQRSLTLADAKALRKGFAEEQRAHPRSVHR